jgi:hypothetical protein
MENSENDNNLLVQLTGWLVGLLALLVYAIGAETEVSSSSAPPGCTTLFNNGKGFYPACPLTGLGSFNGIYVFSRV